jgi:small GTP-binding protein
MSLEITYKIILVGNSKVGKTSFLHRLIDNHVPTEGMLTNGVDYRSYIQMIDNKQIKLHIWDASGQKHLRSIVTSYYRDAVGIMLFFDLERYKSLVDCESWIDEIMEFKEQDPSCFKIMLIGTKSDVECKIEPLRISDFIEHINNKHDIHICYAEISSRTGDGVTETIEQMTQNIYTQWPISNKTVIYPRGIRIEIGPIKKSSCVIS